MTHREDVIVDTTRPATFEQNISLTIKGGSALFVGKLFTLVFRFIVALLLMRLLGPEGFGLYSIALSAGTLASGLALMGLDSALVRYVALYVNRHDEERIWGSLQIGIGIVMASSALMSAILFALAHVIANNIFHNAALAPMLQLISFIVPFLGLADVLAGATRGFNHMEDMVIAQNFAQPITRVVLLSAFAITGLDIGEAVVIFGVAVFVASLVLFYFLNKRFSLRRPLHTARRETREVLSYSIPLWMSAMITTFRGSIQTFLLGSLNTVFTVGVFSAANQLNLVADLVQSSATTAVRPIIVQVHDRNNRDQLGRLYQIISKWLFAFNFPVFLVVVTFPVQILSIFGEGFTAGATALILLSWASVVDAGTGMCGAILDMTGHSGLKLANGIVQMAVVMVLSLMLIPRRGMEGAATAALVGEIVVNGMRLAQVYILFRLLPYSVGFFKPILAGIVALLVTLAASRWLPASAGYLQMIVQMALLGGTYAGAVLVFGLDPQDRAVLSQVKQGATRKLSQIRA